MGTNSSATEAGKQARGCLGRPRLLSSMSACFSSNAKNPTRWGGAISSVFYPQILRKSQKLSTPDVFLKTEEFSPSKNFTAKTRSEVATALYAPTSLSSQEICRGLCEVTSLFFGCCVINSLSKKPSCAEVICRCAFYGDLQRTAFVFLVRSLFATIGIRFSTRNSTNQECN